MKRPHPLCARGGEQVVVARSLQDQAAHLVRHRHDLIDARCGPCSPSGRSARRRRARTRLIPRGDLEAVLLEQRLAELHPLLAVAQLPHEPLGDDALDVEVTRKGSIPISMRRAAASGACSRAECGQHQVPGQRGLDGDLRGLGVADLADHHHVRVVAQHRAQPGREVSPALGSPASADAASWYSIGSSTVRMSCRARSAAERRVERRGLAGAGRAGHEDRPWALPMSGIEALRGLVRHAERSRSMTVCRRPAAAAPRPRRARSAAWTRARPRSRLP